MEGLFQYCALACLTVNYENCGRIHCKRHSLDGAGLTALRRDNCRLRLAREFPRNLNIDLGLRGKEQWRQRSVTKLHR